MDIINAIMHFCIDTGLQKTDIKLVCQCNVEMNIGQTDNLSEKMINFLDNEIKNIIK